MLSLSFSLCSRDLPLPSLQMHVAAGDGPPRLQQGGEEEEHYFSLFKPSVLLFFLLLSRCVGRRHKGTGSKKGVLSSCSWAGLFFSAVVVSRRKPPPFRGIWVQGTRDSPTCKCVELNAIAMMSMRLVLSLQVMYFL